MRACIVVQQHSSDIIRWWVTWRNAIIIWARVTPYASSAWLINYDIMLQYADIMIMGYYMRACTVSILSYSSIQRILLDDE
jgi:hypothetical protein